MRPTARKQRWPSERPRVSGSSGKRLRSVETAAAGNPAPEPLDARDCEYHQGRAQHRERKSADARTIDDSEPAQTRSHHQRKSPQENALAAIAHDATFAWIHAGVLTAVGFVRFCRKRLKLGQKKRGDIVPPPEKASLIAPSGRRETQYWTICALLPTALELTVTLPFTFFTVALTVAAMFDALYCAFVVGM